MDLLRCLMVGLFVCPVMVFAAAQGDDLQAPPGASQAAPVTGTAEAAQTQRALLEKRVAARWDALIRKDFAAAYSFTSPAYRKLYSEDRFRNTFGNKVAWKRVEVVNVDFKGDDAATVGINIYFVYHPPQAERDLDMRTYVQESWVFVDGQWWYLVKN